MPLGIAGCSVVGVRLHRLDFTSLMAMVRGRCVYCAGHMWPSNARVSCIIVTAMLADHLRLGVAARVRAEMRGLWRRKAGRVAVAAPEAHRAFDLYDDI